MAEDRESLKSVLAQIEKDLGLKVQKLSDAPPVDIETIRSGSFLLDDALGVPGYPRGRIIEVFGAPSGGKCIKLNSLVFCDQGLVAIERFGTPEVKGQIPLKLKVKDRDGFSNTSFLYNNGVSDTIKMTSAYGYGIEGTPDHPVLILHEDGLARFKKLKDIVAGDVLCVQRNQQCWGTSIDLSGFSFTESKRASINNSKVPTKMTKELARLLGYLVAEGYTTSRNMTFTNYDPLVMADFNKCSKQCFDLEWVQQTFHKGDYRLNSEKIWQFLQYCGIVPGVSKDKEIPHRILTAPKEIVVEFLKAYYEGDGGVEVRWIRDDVKTGVVSSTSASELFSTQLHTLLLNFGIISSLHSSMKAATNGTKIKRQYWTVKVSGENTSLFADQIGFMFDKNRKLAEITTPREFSTNVDSVPYIFAQAGVLNHKLSDKLETPFNGGRGKPDQGRSTVFPGGVKGFTKRLGKIVREEQNVTYGALATLLDSTEPYLVEEPEFIQLDQIKGEHFFYDKVTSLKASRAHTFDFEVPSTHSFIANGIINHNTSLALAAIASAQALGGTAAFIDVEHAFSRKYAQDLGVDVDNLYFVQPDYGEQALETMERLIASNSFDIIVLDSTAALVPKAEMEEDMEKQSMGLQAKLMSKACRKITPIIGKTKTVAIFINQIRQSMSMYGSPTTTPGGEALKFYSSVRLSVRKVSGSEIKEGTNILGHRMAINVVKNKVAPPMKTTELTFLYGKGIDKVADLIEFALDKGFLEHKGHTYTFEDQKWVGRENAAEGIRSNPEIYKAIAQKVIDSTTKSTVASN